MNAVDAKNYAAMLSVLISLGEQITMISAALHQAQAEGRDVTDDEVAAARARAVRASDELAAS